MSSIRIKNLQSASPLIEQQFNEMQFVVDMDEPDTTLRLSGAELKEAVGVQAHGHTIAEVEELQTALDRKLDKSGGTITGDLKVEGNARIKSLQVEEYLEVPELRSCLNLLPKLFESYFCSCFCPVNPILAS